MYKWFSLVPDSDVNENKGKTWGHKDVMQEAHYSEAEGCLRYSGSVRFSDSIVPNRFRRNTVHAPYSLSSRRANSDNKTFQTLHRKQDAGRTVGAISS